MRIAHWITSIFGGLECQLAPPYNCFCIRNTSTLHTFYPAQGCIHAILIGDIGQLPLSYEALFCKYSVCHSGIRFYCVYLQESLLIGTQYILLSYSNKHASSVQFSVCESNNTSVIINSRALTWNKFAYWNNLEEHI